MFKLERDLLTCGVAERVANPGPGDLVSTSLLVGGEASPPTSSRATLPSSDNAGRCDEVVLVDHPFGEGGL